MKIVYSPECALANDTWISLNKPAKFVAAVRQFDPEVEIIPVQLLPNEVFYAAHSREYVDALLAGRIENGFGNTRLDVANQIRYANSAFVQAAELSLATGIACSPVSGFHHAGYSCGGGYCSINALIIAAQKLKCWGLIDTCLIIDGDGHFGDGTADIIKRLNLKWVTHLTRGAPLGGNTIDLIREAIANDKADVVLYQAGADAHADDNFGAGYLTTEEWKRRDYAVFQGCKDVGVPVVWNLAGGYSGQRTIDLHVSTYATAKRVWAPEPDLYTPPKSAEHPHRVLRVDHVGNPGANRIDV
jgi:acetoin utilization deacetylase AcuC-like enzyme